MLYFTKFNSFGALKGPLKLSEGSSIVLMIPLGNGDGATILSQTYFSSLGFKSSVRRLAGPLWLLPQHPFTRQYDIFGVP